MKFSLSAKNVLVLFIAGVCATQSHARQLYKWVDQTQVTNYSEFQPRVRNERSLQVLKSTGSEHIDPAMAVTKDMKPIEIPVVALNPTSTEKLTPTDPALINKNLRTTKTVFRQGDLFELDGIYVNPNLKYKLNEQAEVQQPLVVDKADSAAQTTQKVNEPVVEKARKAPVVEQVRKAPVVTEEKKPAVVAAPEKKVKPSVNPWSRTPDYAPSNLISTPPVKSSTP